MTQPTSKRPTPQLDQIKPMSGLNIEPMDPTISQLLNFDASFFQQDAGDRPRRPRPDADKTHNKSQLLRDALPQVKELPMGSFDAKDFGF